MGSERKGTFLIWESVHDGWVAFCRRCSKPVSKPTSFERAARKGEEHTEVEEKTSMIP